MPNIDSDNPELRATVGRLATLLAGQLEGIAQTLAEVQAAPWQICAACARLDKLRVEVEYLRRDVSKFNKPEDES